MSKPPVKSPRNTLLIKEIREIHSEIKTRIESRLREFSRVWKKGSGEDLFIELAFCIFTPQSGARTCWRAVSGLLEKDLFFKGCYDDIRKEINIVRFRNNKAGYLIEARDRFLGGGECLRSRLDAKPSVIEKRDWLVKNVKGIGYKEASHFLRNIGFGADIAILDRHILRNMNYLGLIKKIPGSISPALYRELELKLAEFAGKIKIPLGHLDFVLWYKETGDIFK